MKLKGPLDQHIGGSSPGVIDGKTAAQVLQSAASESSEEQSSNEAKQPLRQQKIKIVIVN